MSMADTLLQQTLTGKRQPTAPFEGPQEGIVVAADGSAGTLTFTIPAFNRQVAFGPAPYPRPAVQTTSLSTTDGITPDPHGHTAAVPPAGTRCLVVFAGPDAQGDYHPWVVGFAGWPA